MISGVGSSLNILTQEWQLLNSVPRLLKVSLTETLIPFQLQFYSSHVEDICVISPFKWCGLLLPHLMLHPLESLILFLDYINDYCEQYQRIVRLPVPLPASFVCGFFSNHSAHRVHSCWKLLLRLWAPEVCVFSQFPVGSEQKSLKETTIGQDFSVARSLPLSVVRDCLEV